MQRSPSSVVELSRAVALAMAFGPAAGLKFVDALLERFDEAGAEFKRAVTLARNACERELPLERARTCVGATARK